MPRKRRAGANNSRQTRFQRFRNQQRSLENNSEISTSLPIQPDVSNACWV